MAPSEALNPALYRRLCQLYGKVHVSNLGQAMLYRTVTVDDDFRPTGVSGKSRKRSMLSVTHKGEYYSANCPFCKDTKKRLYVNHMFGKKDDSGRRMTFLAFCFNENCLDVPANRDRFVYELQSFGSVLDEFDVKKGVVVGDEAQEVEWPGPCVPLAKLPPTHKARAYLEGARGFDARVLTDRFKVAWCTDSRYFLARDRIIIPVFDRGKLKGWQARHPGELPWKDPEKKRDLPPKYFSCPGARFRSQCIYNFDVMKQWVTGVLVEGPTDVWRGGSMFGCIFGNTVTEAQRRRLAAVFRKDDRTLVMCLDPEEQDSLSTKRVIEYFQGRLPGRFCPVWLPEGTDPGGLDRDWLKAYVKERAAEQGVKVTYRLVKP